MRPPSPTNAEALRSHVAFLEAENAALRRRLGDVWQVLDSATEYAVFAIDQERRVSLWSEGARRLFGYDSAELVGRLGDLLFTPEDRQAGAPTEEYRRAFLEGHAENERWHVRKDGSRFWGSGMVMPLADRGGLVKVLRDTTGRHSASERQQVLVGELSHRLKNMLAMVQSLAAQTLRSTGGDPGSFVDNFTARLRALAKVHSLIIVSPRERVSLAEIVAGAVAAWAEGDRVLCNGPAEILLSAEQAQAIMLALHELGTNAAKYGALSAPAGRVAIRWALASNGSVELTWWEEGGPPVAGPPTRQGFGTRLLSSGIRLSLGPNSSTELHFELSGLRAVVRFLPH